jgi:N utilization substance protein B
VNDSSPKPRGRPGNRPPPSIGIARSKARRIAVQALYQWEVGGGEQLAAIERQFIEEREVRGADMAYFNRLLFGVAGTVNSLDEAYAPVLDRATTALDPVERAILRIGAYELIHCPDVPVRVVINEGVEAAKRFGAEQSHRYINGVLDRIARKLRETEMNAPRPKRPS